MANRWRKLSRREQVEAINATFRYNAMQRGGTPEQMAIAESMCTQLAPKRARVVRPVDKRPVHRSEHQEQTDVVSWWGMACTGYGLPRIALFAIPNGGARDMITGSRLKAEGVRRGVFDLCLTTARGKFHGLYLEMKVGDNRPTPEQRDFERHLLTQGYQASVHWDAGSAIDALKAYLEL